MLAGVLSSVGGIWVTSILLSLLACIARFSTRAITVIIRKKEEQEEILQHVGEPGITGMWRGGGWGPHRWFQEVSAVSRTAARAPARFGLGCRAETLSTGDSHRRPKGPEGASAGFSQVRTAVFLTSHRS